MQCNVTREGIVQNLQCDARLDKRLCFGISLDKRNIAPFLQCAVLLICSTGTAEDSITDNQRTFPRESTGRALLAGDKDTTGAHIYIRFLLCQVHHCPNSVLQQAFGTDDFIVASDAIFALAKLLVAEVKVNKLVCVDELVQKGKDAGFLQASCVTPPGTTLDPERLVARRFIIAAFGWTTMLYTTHLGPKIDPNDLIVHAQQTQAYHFACKLEEKAQRPLLETLTLLAGGIPVRHSDGMSHRSVRLPTAVDPAEDALHVSCLNAATLCRLGNVEFCWVKCVRSHIDFDVVHRRLNVFCLPSFCELNRTKDNNLARYV